IGDDTAWVAAARIQKHRNLQEAVLAVNHGRAGHLTDIGNLPKRDLRATGSGDQHVRNFHRVAPVLRRVTYAHGEAPTSFDCGGDVVFADGGLDHVLNCAHVDAVPGCSIAVRADVQIQPARDLL